jgi:hypothetical protein
MKNKEVKKKYPEIIKSGKKAHRLFIPIIFYTIVSDSYNRRDAFCLFVVLVRI